MAWRPHYRIRVFYLEVGGSWRSNRMKVGVVGSGLVGSTAAYALVMRGVGRQIVLVHKNEARAAAEADDIRHAVPFAHPLEIQSGGYEDLEGCRAIVLCIMNGVIEYERHNSSKGDSSPLGIVKQSF